MASWGALVESERPLVGCFCTVALLHELREAFGPDLECDGIDLLAGHANRAAATAAELGIRPDSPVVLTAARNQVQFSPRHAFRLKVGPGAFVSGTLDRYSVRVDCERESDFPEPARGRFLAFLRSLRLGGVRLGEEKADTEAPVIIKPYPTTVVRLSPKKGKPYLAPIEVVRRIRKEFAIANVDPKAGFNYVGEMIKALVRSRKEVSPKDAAELERTISRYREVRKDAIFVSFGDDPKAGQSETAGYGYVNVLILPEEPMRVGYCCAEHERDASPLVKRFVSILRYGATPER